MDIDRQQITDQLRRVPDPAGGGDIVATGRVGRVAVCDGYVRVKVGLGDEELERKNDLQELVDQAVRQLGEGVKQVNVEFGEAPVQQTEGQGEGDGRQAPAGDRQAQPSSSAGSGSQQQQQPSKDNPLPGVKHMVAVGSGKGGVGKSSVAVNLAVGLARQGLRVGLLDGDIYGPSVPTLMGLQDQQPRGTQQTLFPFEAHGIKTMSIGKLVESDKPLIWRGPMAHGAFRQLSTQTDWGELDYLIIDMPPGTGDVPLTMSQLLPLTGAIVVCTPQQVAQDDAVRAVGMFGQLEIDVLGLVENMSYFVGDDDKEYDIFGRGGARRMAERLGLPVLGEVPIHMELRANSDEGNPTANFEGNAKLAEQLAEFARNVHEAVEAHGADTQPSLSIS